MHNNTHYLTTGEFAKLCHTTKHTLFHYCDIHLFNPIYIDDNGYHYYHVLQYDTFMTIHELQSIGMSLAEIKNYLAERSPQGMIHLYDKQEKQIHKQITQLKMLEAHISKQKEKINQVLHCSEPFFIESHKQSQLFCSKLITQRDDFDMTTLISSLIKTTNLNHPLSNSGMLCKSKDTLQSENYPFYFYVPTSSSQENLNHVKKAGSYLCSYHYGDYKTLNHTYQKILIFAKEHQLDLDEWIYSETIIGDWAVKDFQDYIIKVCIKINKK